MGGLGVAQDKEDLGGKGVLETLVNSHTPTKVAQMATDSVVGWREAPAFSRLGFLTWWDYNSHPSLCSSFGPNLPHCEPLVGKVSQGISDEEEAIRESLGESLLGGHSSEGGLSPEEASRCVSV